MYNSEEIREQGSIRIAALQLELQQAERAIRELQNRVGWLLQERNFLLTQGQKVHEAATDFLSHTGSSFAREFASAILAHELSVWHDICQRIK